MTNFSAFWRRGSALLPGLLLLALATQAQKYSPIHFSAGYGLLSVERDFEVTSAVSNSLAKDNILLYGANLGGDIAVKHFSDEMTLGLGLNVGAWLSSKEYTGSGFSSSFLLTLPEYVTFRYGAHSSRKSQQNFGFGAGLGYRFGFGMVPTSVPAAMVEGVYAAKSRDYMLRFSTDLTNGTVSKPTENPAISEMRLRMLAVTLGFTL